MAGRSYLATWAPGVKAIVRRNPNYAGTRPHRLDAIAYELAVPAATRSSASAPGAQPVWRVHPLPLSAGGDARSPPKAGTHLFRPVALENRFLAVNAQSGPFRDRRLRRAVSLALDRPALAALWAARPAQRLIPPPLPGSAATDRAAEPDVAAAARLVAGRHVHARLVSCRIPAPSCAQAAELVRRQLARAGITVEVRLEDDPARATRADLRLGTNTFDAADQHRRPVAAGSRRRRQCPGHRARRQARRVCAHHVRRAHLRPAGLRRAQPGVRARGSRRALRPLNPVSRRATT